MLNSKLYSKGLYGFRSLFEDLYPPLCLFANGYLNNMDAAKDIVQEVFIKIWQKQPTFANHDAAKAYCYTAVKNHCLNCLKSKQHKTMGQSTPVDLATLEGEDHFFSEMATVETYANLYRAIETLPKKTAKVVHLALNEYSNKEIAEELEVTASTVRTQKSQAYQKLRGLLKPLNSLFSIFSF